MTKLGDLGNARAHCANHLPGDMCMNVEIREVPHTRKETKKYGPGVAMKNIDHGERRCLMTKMGGERCRYFDRIVVPGIPKDTGKKGRNRV